MTGIVSVAELERKAGRFAKKDEKIIKDIFKWLNSNITCPPYRANKRNWNQDCICWWRLSGKQIINKMRRLIWVLREYGMVVRTLYTDRLSNIRYKDKYQVVAEWT